MLSDLCWCSSLDGVRTPSGDVTLQREDYVKLRSGRMGRVACLSWSKEFCFQELVDIRGLNVLLGSSIPAEKAYAGLQVRLLSICNVSFYVVTGVVGDPG